MMKKFFESGLNGFLRSGNPFRPLSKTTFAERSEANVAPREEKFLFFLHCFTFVYVLVMSLERRLSNFY
jgi:hypothetical protein